MTKYIIGPSGLQDPKLDLDNSPQLSSGITGREPQLGGERRHVPTGGYVSAVGNFPMIGCILPISVEWEIFSPQFQFYNNEDDDD